jgi:hypothetical protein
MSAKNLDDHIRWRSKTIAFRVSPEENEQIEIAVRLSGLTKQDYITRRLLNRDIVVQGNPSVYKALRGTVADFERVKRAFGPEEVERAVENAKRKFSRGAR